MNEDELISLFYKGHERPVDDCAYLAEHKLLITADSMVEHTHFQLNWTTAEQLAHKLFQINLSDIAASGGDPKWCILQMGFPASFNSSWIQSFSNSFRNQCDSFDCKLIGGDTFRSDNIIFSLTMAGNANQHIQRKAEIGDAIYLTGEIGWSLTGLQYLEGKRILNQYQKQRALKRHLTPNARLDWAQQLRTHSQLHGMMDISDGLLIDASRFAKASNSIFNIYLDKLPKISQLPLTPIEQLSSGEEYELLFTAPTSLDFSFPVHQIGTVQPRCNNNSSMNLQIFEKIDDQQPLDINQINFGYQHFQE